MREMEPGKYFFNSEEYLKAKLMASAEYTDKPDKENPANRPFRFPKYIDTKIVLSWPALVDPQRVEYLSPAQSSPKSPSNFSMSLGKILGDKRTACMIKNIPNRYTSEMMVDFINETHFGLYDFFYLRMDFKNRCNVGYAFINFVDNEAVLSFYERINGYRWCNFSSHKIAELTYASIQGIDNLKRKFKRSLVMLEDRTFRPKVFYTEGPHKGKEKREFE